ncbi:lamin tail domain-containing protein [Bacteroidales bacterium OttesenSCG-928-L14]|nr:lamin tail domain-containing protein [Bacteroidales bacterium OttesenSCG-928-L14]
MKSPCLLIILFFLFSRVCFAQLNDCFDDGDFMRNPEWQGTLHLFQVNDSEMLQLNAYDENEAYLFTENSMKNHTEWNFRINFTFAPSTNNYAIVWLIADNPIPSLITEGYYLKFGEAGSNDAIELYSFSNNENIKVIRGIDGNIASSFYKDIKVEHDNGKWTLLAKNIDNDYFIKEGEGFCYTSCLAKYFGLHCVFTSSNSNKFYFDNFLIQELNIDTTLPEISNIIYKNNSSIILEYSKAVANGINKYNYILEEQFSYPDEVIVIGNSGKRFQLNFFEIENEYRDRLCITNIIDYRDNIMKDTCIDVHFHEPDFRNIVINEVMFDVNPAPNRLPAQRYIELLNTTEYNYDISSWQLNSGDKTFEFPNEGAFINEYLLLTINKSDYEGNNVIGIPSFTLKSSDTLSLINNKGKIIDRMIYNADMFFSETKYNGGWSLEQINPYLQNSKQQNWHECIDDAGGTPLARNSVNMLEVIFGKIPFENDLLINEVMFNALDGYSDYVEIINVSDKIISLRDVDFCVYSIDDVKTYPIGLANDLIYPSEIKLLSSNVDGLSDIYPYCDENNFIVSSKFPNLKNDESHLGLQNKTGEILDKMYYNSNMHFGFLKDIKGVSLERLSIYKSSNDKNNWHSAAQSYNYGSPGVENSHRITEESEDSISLLEISPKVISPNNDGIDDIVEICYNLNELETSLTICIYNSGGFPIKFLLKNEFSASTNCIFWDGVGDNGMTVPIGSYIIVVDGYSATGKRFRIKDVLSVRY